MSHFLHAAYNGDITLDEYQALTFQANDVFAVLDESYDRMLGKLKGGAPFVKSFSVWGCPHADTGRVCSCPYQVNKLSSCGERMVRVYNGETKPIVRASEVKNGSLLMLQK